MRNEMGMLQKKGTKARNTNSHAGAGVVEDAFVAERAAGGVAVKKSEKRKKTDLAELRVRNREGLLGFT